METSEARSILPFLPVPAPFFLFLLLFCIFFSFLSYLFLPSHTLFLFLSSIVLFSMMTFDCLIILVGSTSSLASPSTSLPPSFLSFLFLFCFDLPISFAVSCCRCDGSFFSFSFPLFCRRHLTESSLDFFLP